MYADDHDSDELLDAVARELRRPMRFDPEIDARVLTAIRVERKRRARPLVWLGGGLAAAAALALVIGGPGRSGTPGARPVTIAASAPRPVQLRLDLPASSDVAVLGDFNDWKAGATPLRRSAESGEWVVELRLPPGRYRYTFLVDGRRWVSDPAEPPAPDSDFGAPVSVLTVS
ncbi:MAG TPA: isoamylase early set domain-containing protein [Gemmatimonadales bacterium]|nr:isoamylase early set domain-containing protein [Gemmatimonadales bacterium]